MPDTDRWWPALAEVTGLDPKDPRFATHEKRCDENRLLLMELLDQAIRKRPAAHWRRVFNERQMSADVIEDYRYPAADEMARDNRYILDVEHAGSGKRSTLGFPIFMSDTPAGMMRPAPKPGEHTREILRDVLGHAPAAIDDLVRDKVIA
jgi:crotonobetainyl-CoA:carnitine CoA-transferase CaiB-like acyl-CoA transferase